MRILITALAVTLLYSTMPALAKTGLPIPRFVSLRATQINVRVGPGRHYPIEWVFVKANYPVEITAEFDNWRKIRDIEGSEGWVHQSMLSGTRFALIQKEEIELRDKPKNDSTIIAKLAKGVIGKLLSCQGQWCRLQLTQAKGWVPKDSIWGVHNEESIN